MEFLWAAFHHKEILSMHIFFFTEILHDPDLSFQASLLIIKQLL